MCGAPGAVPVATAWASCAWNKAAGVGAPLPCCVRPFCRCGVRGAEIGRLPRCARQRLGGHRIAFLPRRVHYGFGGPQWSRPRRRVRRPSPRSPAVTSGVAANESAEPGLSVSREHHLAKSTAAHTWSHLHGARVVPCSWRVVPALTRHVSGGTSGAGSRCAPIGVWRRPLRRRLPVRRDVAFRTPPVPPHCLFHVKQCGRANRLARGGDGE